MAIYYFDIDDNGSVFPDEVGTECSGLDVKREAISALVGIIGESLPDGDHHRLEIKVRNDSGTVVLRLALNFDVESEDLSAMQRSQRYS
jgi:uncharacterized protein DUF6894